MLLLQTSLCQGSHSPLCDLGRFVKKSCSCAPASQPRTTHSVDLDTVIPRRGRLGSRHHAHATMLRPCPRCPRVSTAWPLLECHGRRQAARAATRPASAASSGLRWPTIPGRRKARWRGAWFHTQLYVPTAFYYQPAARKSAPSLLDNVHDIAFPHLVQNGDPPEFPAPQLPQNALVPCAGAAAGGGGAGFATATTGVCTVVTATAGRTTAGAAWVTTIILDSSLQH